MATIPPVSNNELIRTTWGLAVVNELNDRCVKVNGEIGDGTTPPNQWMTGPLVVRAAPGIRLQGTNPIMHWESTAAPPVRYGTVAGTTAGLTIRADGAGVVDIADLVATNTLKANAGGWFGGNGGQVTLIDTSGGGNACYIGLFGNGTMAAAGTRSGYVGFPGSTTLTLLNELAGGAVRLATTGAGDIAISPGVAGEITFNPNNVYAGRMVGPRLLWGKAATALGTVGVEMLGAGTAGGGIYSTIDDATRNLYCRHEGAANADGQHFITFMAGATQVGRIEQTGGSGISLLDGSDYRLKTVVGPIGDAVDRVKALKPVRVTWIDDAARGETDAFIAHEVAPVVPDAVSGAKDAVDGDGQPVMQGLDYSKLVTVAVAALQDVIGRVEALEQVTP